MISICKLILIYLINNHDSMNFKKQLIHGHLAVAYCTNSGSMKTCLENHAEIWLTPKASNTTG